MIWTQGCSIHCKGCWNHDTWSFQSKQLRSVQDLLKEILSYKNEIEGITILGGEPLDQFEEVFSLVQKVIDHDLSIVLYTGYELQEIQCKGFSKILEYIDILIPGRYMMNKRNIFLQWRGSENQEIHFLSDRYKNYECTDGNYIEINIDESAKLTIIGYPEETFTNF